MRFAIAGLGLALLVSLAPTSARAASEETAVPEATSSAKTGGARFELGALMLAHVRRETSDEKEPGTLAPGAALGVSWRIFDAWQLEATLRGAHYEAPSMWKSRRTIMLSTGGRARWFIAPSSSVSPFVDFGIDLYALAVDEAHGIGPSAHLGAGVEVFHDDAHHRLRLGLGVDVPAFALTYPQASLACDTCEWFSTGRPLYVIPATIAATWTF
jgi:hypothetical protein